LRFNDTGLSINSLASQAFTFFVGAFETSSSTMTYCLYELSLHQDIQDRLRDEIDVVLQKHDGKISYEGIQEMEYLDKVVSGKAHSFKNTYVIYYILSIYPKTGHIALHNTHLTVTSVFTYINFAHNTW